MHLFMLKSIILIDFDIR